MAYTDNTVRSPCFRASPGPVTIENDVKPALRRQEPGEVATASGVNHL
ncbi:MAG: hypothetical protein ACR2K1_08755 [Saprospiraceae bacterium]